MGEFFTARDFRELAAYYAVDPWGGVRTDLPTAQLCSMLTGMFGSKSVPVERFMPFIKKPEPVRPSPAQLDAKMNAIARRFGAGVPQ